MASAFGSSELSGHRRQSRGENKKSNEAELHTVIPVSN